MITWLRNLFTPAPPKLGLGNTLLPAELPLLGNCGDTSYTSVRLAAILEHYDTFRQVLFGLTGITKWDPHFDCNHFAALYVATAKSRYAREVWHTDDGPQTLALAEVWYRPTTGPAHAIVAAHTEDGLVFIEPQTGRRITDPRNLGATLIFVRW